MAPLTLDLELLSVHDLETHPVFPARQRLTDSDGQSPEMKDSVRGTTGDFRGDQRPQKAADTGADGFSDLSDTVASIVNISRRAFLPLPCFACRLQLANEPLQRFSSRWLDQSKYSAEAVNVLIVHISWLLILRVPLEVACNM